MSPCPTTPSLSLALVSKCTVYPDQPSSLGHLKLSVSDLPMLACHYIQKGILFTRPLLPSHDLIPLLKLSLSRALSHFPPLAGRLSTDPAGFVHIACNGAGVDFAHAIAPGFFLRDVLHSPTSPDVPDAVKKFFLFDGAVSYEGHSRPLAAVQVTELADGLFVGCSVNHAVVDGTSFWNFFNTWAEVCRGAERISRSPDFRRNFIKDSLAVLRFPEGGPKVSFDAAAPIRERIFHFSREAIQDLKARANHRAIVPTLLARSQEGEIPIAEIFGKQMNDNLIRIGKGIVAESNGKVYHSQLAHGGGGGVDEISSFQSLCAHLWRSVTRARKLGPGKETTFRMAVNCRQRVEPRVDPYYFGNAIQSIRTVAKAGEVTGKELGWSAGLLHRNVIAHGDGTVRKSVEEWEREPKVFPLGNPDGASITMGSSPRFPMYDNDLGWGRPVAVRSGLANKFDGKISAFPGKEGGGSVDLEVCLAPETMAGLEADPEFMHYVTSIS